MSKARTDIHRVGAIVPADYHFVLFYALATTDNGWPVPSFNIDLVVKLRQTVKFAAHGSTGKCTVCGAHFIEGAIWRHEPTGEHIHIGHQCADKYDLRVDWSPLELARERQRIQAQREATAERNRTYEARQRARAEEYLESKPALRAALALDHPIVKDIAERFYQYASLSPKQEALVLKIHQDILNPAPAEVKVAAPTGRITFRGTIVSAKTREGFRGGVEFKITVKVKTAEGGVWLAWGTCPSDIWDENLKGVEVEIKATLQPGNEPHFVFFKRPKVKLLKLAESLETA